MSADTSATAAPPVWPWHSARTAHADPVSAVEEFLDFVGFDERVALSEFRQGDSRSGEFVIDAHPNPEPDFALIDDPADPWPHHDTTTVFVRLDDADHWVVIGAKSDGLTEVKPMDGESISSPLRIEVTNTSGADLSSRSSGRTEPANRLSMRTSSATPLGSSPTTTSLPSSAGVPM